jgi:hypothetical protein
VGKRQLATLARHVPEDAVDEPACAPLARPLCQIHRVVHNGGSRDTREVQQLVDAEPKDVDHLGVQFLEGASSEVDDQVIECGAPALDAGADVGGERTIAIVLQRAARMRDGRREISAAR